MKRVQVVSTGSYLPGEPITNEDMERLVGPLPDDILEGIQVKTRHWMIDPATGEHRINNSEMAVKATQQALDLAGLEPGQVDLLVLSTASPEYLLPPEVTLVQEKLGLRRCALPRAGSVSNRRRHWERVDLTVAGADLPRQGPRRDQDAGSDEPLQLRRWRRSDRATGAGCRR